MLNIIHITIIIAAGLILGSFLNVCIVRIPKNQSIISPTSHCPHCENSIKWWQNIPVISFILLKGRCSFCKERISSQYPLVELLTALILLGLFLRFDWTTDYIYYSVILLLLIPIAVIDLQHYLIFDSMTLPGIVLGLVLAALLKPGDHTLISALLGLVVGIGSMTIIRLLGNYMFKKDTMGIGDIKLAGLIGSFLGWQIMSLSIFLAAIMIVLVSSIQLAIKKSIASNKFPFGFYFSLAALVGIFFGNELIQAYLNFIFQTN